MANEFIKSATKKSLLALTKKPLDARGWARLLESIVTKDELQSFVASASEDTEGYVRTDGTTEMTADWDAGNHQIRAKSLKSDVATGTAPLTVASTTKVTNLNSDQLDSQTGTYYLDSDNFTGTEWTDLTDSGDTTIHKHDKYILHSLADAANDFLVASGDDTFAKKTLAETGAILEGDIDHGNIQGIADDDHSLYLLASDATDRSTFATDWEDLTDSGSTTLHTHGHEDSTVEQKFYLHSYIDVKARNAVYSIHGHINSLDTGSALDSVPTDIVVTAGTGKLLVVINAGGDVDGEITVTGTTVNRDTGAETGADTDTLTVDALTTDASGTDASGNATWDMTGAYITSKWFKGSVTLSTTNLTLTDVDTYQVAFDQMDDETGITIQTFDITAHATNANAWMYAYLYSLTVDGDKCDIDEVSALDLPAAEVSANLTYHLRRGNLATGLDGATDGFWIDMFPGPLASAYWENINVDVRGELTRTVDPGDPLGPLPVTINWEDDTIAASPTETPMYSSETSTVRALVKVDSVPDGLTKMVETITVAGNHPHSWRSPDKFDISNGVRIEVVGIFPSPATNADFYVGLASTGDADGTYTGIPDHNVMALFRDDDNDYYHRYSTLGVDDWVTEGQTDLSENMAPTAWGHFQLEYIPDDDDLIAQYRNIATENAGGWKTISLTSAWDKPQFAYVFFGGLNNSSSFVRVANVWVGALTDSWPYVGTL